MIEEVLRESIGRRLTSACGTFFALGGRIVADPLALWLGFEGMKLVRFSGASDGWHLVADDVEPEGIDMQEAGSVRISRFEESSVISRLLGRTVRQAWLVVSPGIDDVIGFRLYFDNGETLRVLNWGDSTYIGAEFPADADLDEISERRVVGVRPWTS